MKAPRAGFGGPIARSTTGLCHWAGEPASCRAAESSSRRAAERASARQTSPPCPHCPRGLSRTHPTNAVSRHRRVPPFAFTSSPAPHSHAWPFAVAKSTQVCRRNCNQPGSGRRATFLARSGHSAATGESAPSVTLPRASSHSNEWCGQTHLSPGHPAIDASDTSASLGWAYVGQPVPKIPSNGSHEARSRSEEFLGSHGLAPPEQDSPQTPQNATIWPRAVLTGHFPSQGGSWIFREKVPLGVWL